MEFRTNRKLMVTFSAISLTDIVLLLLIFFLLSSSYVVQPGIKVELPKAVSAETTPEQRIVITVTRQQEIFLNGKRVVLGDLGELGADAEVLHGELGLHAPLAGVDLLLTCGCLSRAAADSFGGGARHFDTREALVEALAELLRPGDTVLVKGSRAAAMDRVVEALCGEVQAC